jgi:serine phosphatase RsbU (regulator of sigma subunit)
MQGSIRAIAVEIVRADGTRLPALVNSSVRGDEVRTVVFDATDRRLYEEELLRARRHEQDIAQRLQRSILSGDLPQAPGVDLDVVYRPAESGLEVGGDWYDAFWVREPRTLGVVVGDVVGRGIDAAATMGQLRSAMRALASTGLGPGRLLDALDGFVQRHAVGRMTTVVYGELDLEARTLRYAAAGHPPPLVARTGEAPAFLWEGRSVPLNAFTRVPRERREATTQLEPGTRLLLYSDGLVERRSEPVTQGMERLRAAITDDSTAASLADELADREHADDVCVLAAKA